MKPTVRQRVIAIHNHFNGELEFISGKWFYRKEEVKNPKRFFLTNCQIDSMNDLRDIMDMYIGFYGEKGLWHPLPVIDRASRIKQIKPLAFPLNVKQLMIINKLLNNDEEVCFITTGVGGSGKSTFLNIIKQIFDNDVSSCALSDLTGFQLAESLEHRLIASDELSADDLDNKSLKTIISKQTIQVNPKFEKPYEVMAQSVLFYCCNIPPRIDLDDTGILRRIVYYEMNEKIKNPDPTLNHKVYTREDIDNIVAAALRMDMTNWRSYFDGETHLYLLKNNSVYRYRNLEEYWQYQRACGDAHLRPYAEPKWETIRALIKEWGMMGETPPDVMTPIGDDDDIPF